MLGSKCKAKCYLSLCVKNLSQPAQFRQHFIAIEILVYKLDFVVRFQFYCKVFAC